MCPFTDAARLPTDGLTDEAPEDAQHPSLSGVSLSVGSSGAPQTPALRDFGLWSGSPLTAGASQQQCQVLAHRIVATVGDGFKVTDRHFQSLCQYGAAAYRQIVWYWERTQHTGSTQVEQLAKEASSQCLLQSSRLKLLPATRLLSASIHKTLADGNAAPQHMKDILSVRALFLFGGVYADLKSFPIVGACAWKAAKQLDPTCESCAVLVATEPCYIWTGMTRRAAEYAHMGGTAHAQPSLALMAAR